MPDTTVTVTAGMPTTVTVTGGVIDVTIDVQRGIQGIQGIQGEGVPAGGSTHQVLRKINATDFNTEFATLGVADIGGAAPIASPTFTGTVGGITKSMVGLGNVDNTADTAKPVSTAQQTALDLKANILAPTLTDSSSIPSIDTDNRYLIDSGNTPSIDWHNRTLDDTNDVTRLDWNSSTVNVYGGLDATQGFTSNGSAAHFPFGLHVESDDTTLSRSAAGKLAVEGVDVVLTAGTQTVAGAKTLSGQLELTGQSATTANSAMTRSLVDARSLVSLQGSNQTINNVATYTASNMTISLGVGTWELNGLFQTINAATGGAKIYISVVSGALPESYQHRFTTTRVSLGSNNPIFGTSVPAYGSGSFPFRFDIGVSSGSSSLFTLQPSVIVLTSAAQIDIGFSQNTAAVGNLTLYSFSKFWAKRLTH
jgi:hypothetical protein